MEERFYLLKIQLLGIEEAIWRRFVVPADITLDRLHDVIQIVMGWEDYHLHEFTIGNKRYTEDPESKDDGLEGGMYRLDDLIKQKGQIFRYLYDLGDYWEHEIILEENNYDGTKLDAEVACLDGKRACPPEDVGSINGYYDFCKAINDPDHEEYENYILWIGGEYDPEYFDHEAVNQELFTYLRWSRDRYKKWGWM